MKELEARLGYEFNNKAILETALTHSSYANENKKTAPGHNERLEFLGDSILGMTVAEYLFRTQPGMPEGQMTRLRSELVCERSLVAVASSLELGNYLRLGKGEENGGGRTRPSIIADAVEAVIAAIYLDGGMENARAFIERNVLCDIENKVIANTDFKTALQEFIQRKSGQVLSYAMIGESGPDHMKVFTAEARLNGETIGVGEGHNKKEAEQSAARAALESLKVVNK